MLNDGESIRFAEEQDAGQEKKREVRNVSKIFDF